jgi:phosphomannomutase
MADEVVVGRDGRHTGGALVSAFVAGAESVGCDVTSLGVVPTHVVAWKAREEGAYGAAITASHNPPEDNGVKLFRDDGCEFGAEDEKEVAALVENTTTADWNGWTEADEDDAVEEYLDAVSEYVGEHSLDLRVAVDCANGVGARTTVPALKEVGCDVVPVNAQTDPTFPGRGSKPTPESLVEFVEFVRKGGFDIGFAHDGDADRLVVVDGEGIVSEDAVLAVLARRHVRGTEADTATVLTTPNVSPRVDEAVREAGGDVERVALGTISEEARGRDVAFAGEPWKHVFPEFGGWVDGTVSAVEVARAYAEDETVFDGMRDVDVTKKSVTCDDGKKTAVMATVEEKLRNRYDDTEATFDTADGIRVDIGDGSWFLVRASGTEPLVRVYAEGDDELVETLVSLVEEAVRSA